MLTDATVILTILDPIENRVTNFTNATDLSYINRKSLVEERFTQEDVSILFLQLVKKRINYALRVSYSFLFSGSIANIYLKKTRMLLTSCTTCCLRKG
jgi:hypothetical protein